MACALAGPDVEDVAVNARESQVRDPSGSSDLRWEDPVKTEVLLPCCLRTPGEGHGSDAPQEADLTLFRSSPRPFQNALCQNADLMLRSPGSERIENDARDELRLCRAQHVVDGAPFLDVEVGTAMSQYDCVQHSGERAFAYPSVLVLRKQDITGVSCHNTLVPAVTTTVDIEVEPGGSQNRLGPRSTVGTSSSDPACAVHECAYMYDLPACKTVYPVPAYIHGRVLFARDEPSKIVDLESLAMHNAGSRTLHALAAESTTSSPAVGSVLGPLLGGLLGGFCGLILIVIAIWYIWTARHRLFSRQDTLESQTAPTLPNVEYKLPDRSSRRQSTLSSQPPTPQPYQYGVVGRPRSQLSMSTSPPHSPDPTRSRSRSPGTSVLTYSRPPSMTMNIMMPPSPTGAHGGINTPISPGPSLAPSSRPPTPGPSMGVAASYPFPLQQYHNEWQQQQQARVSWPQMSQSEDGHATDPRRSPVLRPRSERRPSRLSLTLANWNPETDGILGELDGGERLGEAQSGEAIVDSTSGSATAVGSSREDGKLGAEASQETLTPANTGPADASRDGS